MEKEEKSQFSVSRRFAIAPMMDWTDRHCRFFHRQMSKKALLYTEMIVADAVMYGDRDRLLGFDDAEHPVALQLGGSDPDKLAEAARIAAGYGYDEVNLNVGCPSDRVQSGTFGACLMREPDLVARCIEAMARAVPDTLPVTVKCRIGVDDQDPEIALFELADKTIEAGAAAVWVHARKAWLDGLSPRENRDVPPLDYDIVYRLKRRHPDCFIGINGGIRSLEETRRHLAHVDGSMIGRAAYQNPGMLADVDAFLEGRSARVFDWGGLIDAMAAYMDRHVANGGKANHVTRHMIGLFHGVPGARNWRQILSSDASLDGANGDVLRKAYRAVEPALAMAA